MNPDSASYSLANLAAENVNESDDDFQVQIALSSRYPALLLQSMISFDPNLLNQKH